MGRAPTSDAAFCLGARGNAMQRFRRNAADLCLGLSVIPLVYGVSLLSRAAAFIVSGVALALVGWVLARTEPKA